MGEDHSVELFTYSSMSPNILSSKDFFRTDTSSFVPCMDCRSAKKQTRQLSYTYAGTTGFYMIKLDEIGYPVFLNSCRGVYEF